MFDFEEATADAARKLLPRPGYRLVHFAYIKSLADVDLILDTTKPNAIMTSAKLLFMRGIDLARHCRTHPKWKDIPVIVYSTDTLPEEDKQHSLAHAFIPQPFENESLKAAIKRLL